MFQIYAPVKQTATQLVENLSSSHEYKLKIDQLDNQINSGFHLSRASSIWEEQGYFSFVEERIFSSYIAPVSLELSLYVRKKVLSSLLANPQPVKDVIVSNS